MKKIRFIAIVFAIVMLIGSVSAFADVIEDVPNWNFHVSYNTTRAGLGVKYTWGTTPTARTTGEANETDVIHVCTTVIMSANGNPHYSTSYLVNNYAMNSGLCYGDTGWDVLSVTHYLFREFGDGTEFMRRSIYSY